MCGFGIAPANDIVKKYYSDIASRLLSVNPQLCDDLDAFDKKIKEYLKLIEKVPAIFKREYYSGKTFKNLLSNILNNKNLIEAKKTSNKRFVKNFVNTYIVCKNLSTILPPELVGEIINFFDCYFGDKIDPEFVEKLKGKKA